MDPRNGKVYESAEVARSAGVPAPVEVNAQDILALRRLYHKARVAKVRATKKAKRAAVAKSRRSNRSTK